MKVLFKDFLSNKNLFYDQFDHAAQNAAEMASLLQAVVHTTGITEREALFKRIDRMENTGDDITHKIYLSLDRIVFTPLNRNDIHKLAAAIDDVADMIQEASGRIYLYNITNFVSPIKELCDFILNAGVEIKKTVGLLRSNNNSAAIISSCSIIKDIERQADQVYYTAVADLFLNDKDAINLIKYREILLSLETAVNKCKSTADVLEVILINR